MLTSKIMLPPVFYLLDGCLLSTCSLISTAVGAGDMELSKIDTVSLLMSLQSSSEDRQQIPALARGLSRKLQ